MPPERPDPGQSGKRIAVFADDIWDSDGNHVHRHWVAGVVGDSYHEVVYATPGGRVGSSWSAGPPPSDASVINEAARGVGIAAFAVPAKSRSGSSQT